MPPRPKTTTLSPGFDLRRVDHRADAGGHAAADIAARVERRVGADFRNRDFRQDGEVGEGRAAHIMIDRLALVGHAAGAVGHQALPWVARIAVHRLVLPDRQLLHWRHSGV